MTIEHLETSATAASHSMELLHLTAAAWAGQTVRVAAKLGIADQLEDGPKTAADLAEAVGAHAGALRRLLRVLVGLGLLDEQSDGRFALTATGDGLRTRAPVSLRAYAVMLGEDWMWRALGDLLHTVRTGEPAFAHVNGVPLYRYLGDHAEAAAVFDAAITDRARQENPAIVSAYDWPDGTIVDVGGGQGSLLAAVLARNANARGIVFEMPHVAAAAAKLIDEAGLGSRCEARAGDFFEHVPEGGDLYLLRRVLHGQDDERAVAILRNCRAAMDSLGRILVIEHVLGSSDVPTWGGMLDLQMLVLSAGGRERDEAEYRALFTAAGLRLHRFIPTACSTSLIEAAPD